MFKNVKSENWSYKSTTVETELKIIHYVKLNTADPCN